jgi:hypothetical protein
MLACSTAHSLTLRCCDTLLMQLQHVESLLDRMTQEGVQPNHISYRTAITGCVAAADSAQVSTTVTTATTAAAAADTTITAVAAVTGVAGCSSSYSVAVTALTCVACTLLTTEVTLKHSTISDSQS